MWLIFLICSLFTCTLVYNSSYSDMFFSLFFPFLFFSDFIFLISILIAEIIFRYLLLTSSLFFLVLSDFAFVGLLFLRLFLYLHFSFIIYFPSLLCIYCCFLSLFLFPAGSVWNAPHRGPHEAVCTSWVVAQVVWI